MVSISLVPKLEPAPVSYIQLEDGALRAEPLKSSLNCVVQPDGGAGTAAGVAIARAAAAGDAVVRTAAAAETAGACTGQRPAAPPRSGRWPPRPRRSARPSAPLSGAGGPRSVGTPSEHFALHRSPARTSCVKELIKRR